MDRELSISCALWDLETKKYTSIRAAASAYNIPRNTLQQRFHGVQKSHTEASVAQQSLSPDQEETLVDRVLEAEKEGDILSHLQLREMAALMSKTSGGTGFIGKNWSQRFLHRHPIIQTKRSKLIEQSQDAVTD